MYEDHLKTCEYCQKAGRISSSGQTHKPTITVKGASSYRKQKKLTELAAIIKGTSYPGLETMFRTKSAKLKELGKLVRGL